MSRNLNRSEKMKKFKASFVKKNENWNDLSWKRKEKGDFRVLKFEKNCFEELYRFLSMSTCVNKTFN